MERFSLELLPGGIGVRIMSEQQFSPGDWVRTESGEVGRVVHTARLTVFVQLEEESAEATVKAFLESQLTKIEPPSEQGAPPSAH